MPEKRIFRNWRDDLPLWSLYACLAASVLIALSLVLPPLHAFFAAIDGFLFTKRHLGAAPPIYTFLKKLDWSIFVQKRYIYLRWIFQGLLMTLRISAISMVLAMILGTLVGVGRLSSSRFIRGICTPYVEFFRNTPLLIQLFFWYFGTSVLLDALASLIGTGHGLLPGATTWLQAQVLAFKDYFNKGQSELIAGVIGLTVYTSAFIAETIRAGIMAIPHGQTEAARASGLNGLQTLVHVILPQAFRITIPPLLSQFLALTKNSAQAMAIGVAEATYMARQVEANTFKGFEAFTVATGLYMVISFLMSYLLNRYDNSISIAELARRKQRLLAMRDRLPGDRLSLFYALLAGGGGAAVFYLGGMRGAHGAWFSAVSFYLLGFSAVVSGLVAVRKPEWGLGYIKGVLGLGAVFVFFELMGKLETGLLAFDDPEKAEVAMATLLRAEILVPLGLATVYGLAAGLWWAYFSRRESLFIFAPQNGERA